MIIFVGSLEGAGRAAEFAATLDHEARGAGGGAGVVFKGPEFAWANFKDTLFIALEKTSAASLAVCRNLYADASELKALHISIIALFKATFLLGSFSLLN